MAGPFTRRGFLGAIAGLVGLVTGAGAKRPIPTPLLDATPVAAALKPPTGKLVIWSGPPPRPGGAPTGLKLATFSLGDPPALASDGTLQLTDAIRATAVATGTPTHAHMSFRAPDGSVVTRQITAGVGSGDLRFDSVITAGGTVTIGGAMMRDASEDPIPWSIDGDGGWDDDYPSEYD